MKWVSLHHHSTFSYMDGFALPSSHVERAAELGMSALALTEHGNVSSHVQLEKAGLAAGVKPIFGCELYTAPGQNKRKWHLTVLSENLVGYRNLNRIVTRSWDEGFYQWPTVSGTMLKEHSDGIIVLSGCADSQLSCALLGGKGVPAKALDVAAGERVVRGFKRIFGDRYFLEVQQFPELERTRTLNPALAELSRRTGVPLVATADCHYPRPGDNEMQKILHAAGRGSGTVAAAEASWEYDIRLTFPTSDEEICARLEATGLTRREAAGAVRNTALIADRCSVTLPRAGRLRFPCPPGVTNETLIWDWLRKGWKYRYPRNPSMRARKTEYMERVKYEMELMVSKDFIDYFLMLSDAVSTAKDNGLPVGPARGSAAASLVCYLLRITEIDPLQFPTMVFERFIDVTREDLPDVDLDFADNRRDEIRQHLIMRYGADHVGNIGNFVRYRGKNAIDDVARVYRIPAWEANIVKDLIVERSGGDSRFDASLEDTFNMFPQAAEVLARHPELAHAMELEGNYRGMSVHAAGIVVANTPINDFVATYTRHNVGREDKTLSALATDKYDTEYLGMLKVDALGLTTMGMIAIALDEIGMRLEDLYDVPLNDAETLAAFKRNDVTGIFQFEGRATRLVNRDVSPDNFMELADINALSRPGPLFSGATGWYVATKRGEQPEEHLHPIVDEIVKWSKYQIIYQEQILQIVRQVGGFPWTHAAAIRKIISQKKGEAAFNAMQDMFIKGAGERDISPELALKIWKRIVTSGTYAFNVAHCVSYSMLAFWAMWLKVHHPLEFYTAALRKAKASGDNGSTGGGASGRGLHIENLTKLVKDAERHGVSVLGPDVATSGATWTADREASAVRAGLTQVPGIGEKTAAVILAEREREPFAEWKDLIRVKGIGPRTIETIRGFAESNDPFGIHRNAKLLADVRDMCMPGNEYGLPTPTHTGDELRDSEFDIPVTWVGVVNQRNMQDYIENARAHTGEEVKDIIATMRDPHLVTSCNLKAEDDGDEDIYIKFNRWNYPRWKNAINGIKVGRDVVVVSGIKRKGFGIAIHARKLWVIEP